MADLTFRITRYSSNKKQAVGELRWPAKSLVSETAVSGPYGKGALPLGVYHVKRSELLDKTEAAYTDKGALGWMQVVRPTFPTPRTDLGIHPDGSVPGTEGCVGLADVDTRPWYAAFQGEPGDGTLLFEVIRSADLDREMGPALADAPVGRFAVPVPRRHLNVLVIGDHGKEHAICDSLGAWIADSGYNLVTGGGGGVMRATARGFCSVADRRGVSIGIIPGRYADNTYKSEFKYSSDRYPNEFVEVPVFTHLPDSGAEDFASKTGPMSRNNITALSGDLVVCVGGGEGTRAELAIARAQGKPALFLSEKREWHGQFGDVPFADDVEAMVRLLS